MKKLIISLLLACGVAQADECRIVAEAAVTIMVARQNGAELPRMLELAKEPFLRQMVLAAYEEPIYTVEHYRKNVARRFAERYLIACYRELDASK